MSIKFVAKANMWCVTYFTQGDKKRVQHQEWLSTEPEAIEFSEEK